MSQNAEQYICSPMQGVLVTASGAPASGVPVTRSWSWRGKRGEDTSVSDAQGRFSFDEVLPKRGFFGRLPAEEAISQNYVADTASGPVNILSLTPRTGPLNHESQGKPFSVTCDVSKEPGHGGFWYGTCRLD
jgi:hypothetical protein